MAQVGFGAMQLPGSGVFGPPREAMVNLRITGVPSDGLGPAGPLVDRELFDGQLAALIRARDEGLIGGVGLSNIGHEHLLYALDRTDVACVQNSFNLIDRSSQLLLDEYEQRRIAFVAFFALGSGFAADNAVLNNDVVRAVSARFGHAPAQIALAWALSAPNVLLIPGASSARHLEENLAAADIELDEDTQRELTAVSHAPH